MARRVRDPDGRKGEQPTSDARTRAPAAPASRKRKAAVHAWAFKARFRYHAFGWRSQPAIKRIKEAVSEIKQVARTDRVLAAEGAVLFLERVSGAIECIDGSSGSIGTAVNNAIAALVPIISAAPADAGIRDAWLERLWDAYQADEIPYIERLGDHWGELCVSKETASHWADELIGTCRSAWSPDPSLRGYFKGTTNCLSALLVAERYEELLTLLELERHEWWHYRQYGVRALAALGKTEEAIRYAERGSQKDSPTADSSGGRARACEEILLAAGRTEEAYERYALAANAATTYLAWFRAIVKKYPHKKPGDVLADLVAHSPGDEGKWFAAAKEAELFDEAIELAWRAPCAPQTLTRAARDFSESRPAFAVEAGLAALHWLARGYGYEVTGADVLNAYTNTMKAAEHAGKVEAVRQRLRDVVAKDTSGFVRSVLSRLGLS